MTHNTQALRRGSVPLIIILGGFALRLYRLGADSLWYDETVSAHLASESIPDLVAHTARDIHPPGYYLLLHAWTRLAGDTQFSLTFLSVFFGVLLIPLTYALAHRLLGRKVALWATLLVAISPFGLWYSQEARMYTLGAALGLVTLWCTLNVVMQDDAPRYTFLLGYTLAASAGLYALYYFGFLLVTLNLLVVGYLLWTRRFKTLGMWLLAQVAVLVLYLPWLPIAWRQATNPPVPPWRSFTPLQTVMIEAWTALSLGQSVRASQVWPVLLLTGGLFVLGLYTIYTSAHQLINNTNAQVNRPTSQPENRWPLSHLQTPVLLVAYTFLPLLLIYLASLITPLYHVRYLFTYAPAFYIVIAAGLSWLTRRAWPLALVAALALLGGSALSTYELHTNPRHAADDFRSAVQFIAERWRPGDAVLINAGYAYTAFLYYYDEPIAGRVRLSEYEPPAAGTTPECEGLLLLSTGTIDGDPDLGWADPESDFFVATGAETAAALERLLQVFPRLWMLRVYDTVTDPGGFIRHWLEANAIPFEDQTFAGEASMRVQGFMSSDQPSPPLGSEVALENGISLLGWEVATGAQAGGPLDVVLWWSAEDSPTSGQSKPATPHAVSLKLWTIGPDKTEAHLIAQQDEWPVGSLLLTPDWPPAEPVRHPMRLWLPADLSPGQYQLEVEMYDPISIQPLARRDGGGHTISLGPVTVTPSQ